MRVENYILYICHRCIYAYEHFMFCVNKHLPVYILHTLTNNVLL